MRRQVFYVATVFCTAFAIPAAAQNLVPNWDFESYTSLPTSYGQLFKAAPWYSALYSVDYFHANTTFTGVGVPSNWFGNENANSGLAYAGIARSQSGSYHEYIGVQLTSPLVINQAYYVEAQVSPGEGPYKWGTNNYGFVFTTYQLMGGAASQPILKTPHVNWTSTILNYNGWNVISGTFIADSAYTHLTMGNFFTTAATTWVDLGAGGTIASMYWYIDDVIVQPSAVLPMELLEFTATPEGETKVMLRWVTATEQNVQLYQVERSLDGERFEAVSTQPGGSSSSRKAYNHVDAPNVFGQPVLYRLKEVDNDGTVHFSDIISITLDSLQGDQLLSVYPNPLEKGEPLHIGLFSNVNQQFHVTLYDITGKQLSTANLHAVAGMNELVHYLPALTAGSYLVTFRSDQLSETRSLLVR